MSIKIKLFRITVSLLVYSGLIWLAEWEPERGNEAALLAFIAIIIVWIGWIFDSNRIKTSYDD